MKNMIILCSVAIFIASDVKGCDIPHHDELDIAAFIRSSKPSCCQGVWSIVNSCWKMMQDCMGSEYDEVRSQASSEEPEQKKDVFNPMFDGLIEGRQLVPVGVQQIKGLGGPVNSINQGIELQKLVSDQKAGGDHVESEKMVEIFPKGLTQTKELFAQSDFPFVFGLSLENGDFLVHLINNQRHSNDSSDVDGSQHIMNPIVESSMVVSVSPPIGQLQISDKNVDCIDYCPSQPDIDDGHTTSEEIVDKELLFKFLENIEQHLLGVSSFKKEGGGSKSSVTYSRAGSKRSESRAGSIDGVCVSYPTYDNAKYQQKLKESVAQDFEQKKEKFEIYKRFLESFVHKSSEGKNIVEIITNSTWKEKFARETDFIFSDKDLTSFFLQIIFPNPEMEPETGSSIPAKYLNLLLRANGVKVSYSRGKFYYSIGRTQKLLTTALNPKDISLYLKPNFEDVYVIQPGILEEIFKQKVKR